MGESLHPAQAHVAGCRSVGPGATTCRMSPMCSVLFQKAGASRTRPPSEDFAEENEVETFSDPKVIRPRSAAELLLITFTLNCQSRAVCKCRAALQTVWRRKGEVMERGCRGQTVLQNDSHPRTGADSSVFPALSQPAVRGKTDR